LNINEVKELLRLCGKMLGHLCSRNQWQDLNGRTGVEWDAIDVPANFMTLWLSQPSLMTSLASHWSSNESLKPDVVEKMCLMHRTQMAGYELCHELYKSAVDIAFYTE